jgi:MFS family permease
MNRIFYVVASSQFLSSLADNALLIASIALLVQMNEPGWFSPALKIFFVIPYVIFAPFVGAFADSRPKGQVMLVSNILKTGGCVLIVWVVLRDSSFLRNLPEEPLGWDGES